MLIFAVTGLFNTLSIRRYKLIDLLSARSKNARFRVRNPWISLVGFLAAVAVIAWSYVTLVDNGLMQFDEGFWRATALMVAGTFLFLSLIHIYKALTSEALVRACALTTQDEGFLEGAAKAGRLSGRAIMRTLALARTIADMEENARVERSHLCEAIGFRLREGES